MAAARPPSLRFASVRPVHLRATLALRRLLPSLLLIALPSCGSRLAGHVEVLASIRHLASGDAWDLEEQAYRAVYHGFLGQSGFRLVITPISDASLVEATTFDKVSPEESFFGQNHDDAEHERNLVIRQAEGVLRSLAARRSGKNRTEIINAIVMAADRLRGDLASSHILIVLSTGFEQSSVMNMADYRLTLNDDATRKRLIDHLKVTGQVPDLRGATVCMVGITNGAGGWSDYNRRRGVQRFWQDYFAAAGANLVGYGSTVASCPVPVVPPRSG
jgi:hypothetical protein